MPKKKEQPSDRTPDFSLSLALDDHSKHPSHI
jgi:hypothetical protein